MILQVKLQFDITVTSQWARWRPKSPASRLFTRPLIQAQIKENIKAPRHWPLWGEFAGNRWIPLTKGQWSGKCLIMAQNGIVGYVEFRKIKSCFSITEFLQISQKGVTNSIANNVIFFFCSPNHANARKEAYVTIICINAMYRRRYHRIVY